mgnify:CR=1 FL=1|jgi:large subunit ribosomal protein L15
MKLNSLYSKNSKNKKRVGRGIGSGKGKTSGRGHKGQKSRSGVAIKSFEGGQMPLYRRLPKRGFKKINSPKKYLAKINLSKIQYIFEKKIILPNNVLSLASLQKVNQVNKKYKKIKLLGTGEIKEKLDVQVNFVSSSAKEKIEKLGGKVSLVK